jgi:hypothetical protein
MPIQNCQVLNKFRELDIWALYLFECSFQKWEGRDGHFRLCTRDQDLASQIAELQAAGWGNIR